MYLAIFVESALKKNNPTPYIALVKTNPQEFPRNPVSKSKIKGCKYSGVAESSFKTT